MENTFGAIRWAGLLCCRSSKVAQQRSRLSRCVWCIWEGANDQRVTASTQTHTKCLQYDVTAQFKRLWKLWRQTIDVLYISCVSVQLRNVTVCNFAELGRFVSLVLIFIVWNNKENRPETETHAHSVESITVLLLEEQNVQLYLSLCCYLVQIYTHVNLFPHHYHYFCHYYHIIS